MTRRAFVHRFSAHAPDDVSGLETAFAEGTIQARRVVAIFGKTEGNGCVNDFSRGLATRALADSLKRAGAEPENVCLIMSGGTEGGLSPHFVVFEARPGDGPPAAGALAVGSARTKKLPYDHLGRLAQVDLVAEGVSAAIRNAGLASTADVHFVQIKCPLLTADRVAAAEALGARTITRDTLKSMGFSRAASALGIGVALGEIERGALTEDVIGKNWRFYSERASTSAGVELFDHEIVVLGRASGWTGPLRIDHALMTDALDIEPVRAALARLGIEVSGQLTHRQSGRLIAMFAKAEASGDGVLRGKRHTMLNDSDISATRHARAFVAGALAGLVGHAEIFVSGGAEHQGPDGGGPVALIVDTSPNAGTAP
jgi:cyanuric acid amidohydrolase